MSPRPTSGQKEVVKGAHKIYRSMDKRFWIRPALIGLAVVAVYSNSFSDVFQFDDYKMIVNYARAHSFVSWLIYFFTTSGRY